MKNMESRLKDAGLTGNETKVYLELIKTKSISANELSKKIGMDRTLVYTLLNNLIEKGLVGYVIKDNKKYFKITNIEALMNSLKEKESIVENIILELKKIKISERIEQEINVYEGKNGAKALVNEIMKEKYLESFGGTGRLYDLLGFQTKHLLKRIKKLGMKGRFIISTTYKDHPVTKIKGLAIRYLESVESPATTTIFGDKVSIHLLTQKPIIIIIKNKEIAEGYRNYFKILWKIAKE